MHGVAMVKLVEPDEEPVVEVHEGRRPFVVACEHASNRLPRALGTLGLTHAELARHIAWDPGAADLAEAAKSLDASLVLQHHSWLAVDCNLDPGLPDAIATNSESTVTLATLCGFALGAVPLSRL